MISKCDISFVPFEKNRPTLTFTEARYCKCILYSQGHGRLVDPPARNVMWQYGYDNPINVDLNQLNCGGTSVSSRGKQFHQTIFTFIDNHFIVLNT